MHIIGIDPGLTGAIAIYTPKIEVWYTALLPTIRVNKNKRRLDSRELSRMLKRYAEVAECNLGSTEYLAIVEDVHSMPKQGVASSFNFGKTYGQIVGVLDALDIPAEYVTPQRWKKEVLVGTKRDKEAAINYVKQRFPHLSLLASAKSKKDSDGIADAVCLAEFGRRLQLIKEYNDGKPGIQEPDDQGTGEM